MNFVDWSSPALILNISQLLKFSVIEIYSKLKSFSTVVTQDLGV